MQRTEVEIERLVHQHQRLVQFQVNRYLKRYTPPGMEREDLVSWGQVGLVQAARKWDPQRGAFSTVACRAIDWALQRGVERESRSAHGVSLSLDEILAGADGGSQPERLIERLKAQEHVERDHLKGEANAEVRSAVASLPDFERRLIERHFYEDEPIARLAAELGMSRQSLSERHRKALRRLRSVLDPVVS